MDSVLRCLGAASEDIYHMDPVSYLRMRIGASDLNEYVYSYDDPPPRGETDPQLVKFSLQEDQKYVIPILKQILAINPKIKILGSPWSAPAWMKTTANVKGGSLKPEYYGAYAKYFAKYVQGMKAQGIHIDAITVQNKPLNEKNTPSMAMSALEQGAFIKGHLGPTFKAAGINTRILLFDHNCNHPDYAMEILNDPQANRWADSSAFHLYEGKITAMSTVHDALTKIYNSPKTWRWKRWISQR
jgi:glucosylceramidase